MGICFFFFQFKNNKNPNDPLALAQDKLHLVGRMDRWL